MTKNVREQVNAAKALLVNRKTQPEAIEALRRMGLSPTVAKNRLRAAMREVNSEAGRKARVVGLVDSPPTPMSMAEIRRWHATAVNPIERAVLAKVLGLKEKP